MTISKKAPGIPHGPRQPMGHGSYPERHLLPVNIAEALADAHLRTGASYRRVARALGLDWSFWHRLTLGQRAPSLETAQRIISLLDLPDDLAEELIEVAVATGSR